jgi:uncharacterized protein YjgD (DUF1641 family)
MDNDIAILNQKIDHLTTQIASLNITNLPGFQESNWDKIAQLDQKVDYLTQQMDIQLKRQQAFEELKDDIVPIVNHMIKLSIDELAEIGSDFESEDLFFLLKRVLRNTNLLLNMMDRLEAIMGVADEVQLLGKQVFSSTVEELDRLEREGFFAFGREGWNIVERIVNEYSQEDLQALGDNIVTIITTIRNMTQPEILSLANNAIGAIQEDSMELENVSTWTLVREFSNPKVRKGLSRMLNIVKALADQPDIKTQ